MRTATPPSWVPWLAAEIFTWQRNGPISTDFKRRVIDQFTIPEVEGVNRNPLIWDIQTGRGISRHLLTPYIAISNCLGFFFSPLISRQNVRSYRYCLAAGRRFITLASVCWFIPTRYVRLQRRCGALWIMAARASFCSRLSVSFLETIMETDCFVQFSNQLILKIQTAAVLLFAWNYYLRQRHRPEVCSISNGWLRCRFSSCLATN